MIQEMKEHFHTLRSFLLLSLLVALSACDRFMDYQWEMYPAAPPSPACVVRALQEDGATPTPGSPHPALQPADIQILEGRDYTISNDPTPRLSIFDRRVQLGYSADTEAKIIKMFEQLEQDIATKCDLQLTKPSVYRCGGCPG